MLYATAVTDSFARQGMHEVNAIVSINLQSDLYDYFPSFSASARKDSLVSFTSEVIYLTIHEGTTKEVMDYINQKITGLLEESEHLSNDVKKQIVYLTVMKHSWYLWRSNGYL